MATTDQRKTVEALLQAIQSIFKKSTRGARERAWNSLTSSKGRSEMGKMINNPERSLSLYRDLVSFKEWLNET